MGKNQHSKDKLWITSTEWKDEWGGKKQEQKSIYKRLPFYCCSLSFQEWEDPVCSPEGHVFEILNIVPFLKKFGKNPVTGTSLKAKDLVKLTFHKNAEGEFHCPVTFKVFSDHTHIVAVRTSGQVYCYEAIEELNIKSRNWKDLMTEEPFTRKDIIVIQDPHNAAKLTVDEFFHVKSQTKVEDEDLEKAKADPLYGINVSDATSRILKQLTPSDPKTDTRPSGASASNPLASSAATKRTGALAPTDTASAKKAKALETSSDKSVKMADPAAKPPERMHYSTGKMAASFTSTSMSVVTAQERAIKEDTGRCPKTKGYVRLQTSHGDLNLELHCDLTPRTCENFMTHCKNGYYNNIIFHRSIRNFMIQGGDPTGTGRGGESIWHKSFADEFRPQLTHSGRGVLSMANSGPKSNGSQFFILYKSAAHLNNKHTVFGRVVGGMPTLSAMEKVPTDEDDRPQQEIRILTATVFVDPYAEMEEEERKLAEKAPKEKQAGADDVGEWYSNPMAAAPRAQRAGVGKYLAASAFVSPIQLGAAASAAAAAASPEDPAPAPQVKLIPTPSAASKMAPRVAQAPMKQFSQQTEQGALKTRTSTEYTNFSGW